MNRLLDLTPPQFGFLNSQILNYKSQRSQLSTGKVYHIQASSANGTDAIDQ